MRLLRFVSTCAITLTLLIFCAILANPTRELLAGYTGRELGPGVLPAICLVGVGLLTLCILISEFRIFVRSRSEEEDERVSLERFGLPLRGFVLRSVAVMSLLGLFILLWQMLSFIPATLVFTIGMGLCVMPAMDRKPVKLVRMALILATCSVVIWAVFVHLLGVSLR